MQGLWSVSFQRLVPHVWDPAIENLRTMPKDVGCFEFSARRLEESLQPLPWYGLLSLAGCMIVLYLQHRESTRIGRRSRLRIVTACGVPTGWAGTRHSL